MDNWHHVSFTGPGKFNGTPVGVAANNCNLEPPLFGCLWEFRRFYYAVFGRDLSKWLLGHGRTGQDAGRDIVQRAAQVLVPGVPAVLVRSCKAQTHSKNPKDIGAKAAVAFQEHVVSSGWLLAITLSFASSHGQHKHKQKAFSLWEDVVATACGQRDVGTVWHILSPKYAGRCVVSL